MKIKIRNEREDEYFYVETVTRCAFWNVYRPGCNEHVMVHKIRLDNDYLPKLDFVAEYDGSIVGNVMCSQAKIYNDQDKLVDDSGIVCIGPIGVLPQYQNQGIGSMLMEEVKKTAKATGYKGLVLYGNPAYYHRFGFVNAEKYNITTPDGSNFEDFMLYELAPQSLSGIHGRCFESEAFDVTQEELDEFERNFIGKVTCRHMNDKNLDYSRIKQEFLNAQVDFPLKEEECVGLTQQEKLEITPCGIYCGDCDDYGVVCDGCRNRHGRPIWYNLFSKQGSCEYYPCTEKNQYHDCSQCAKAPCSYFFEYPDPNMSDEDKQMWIHLRMENINQLNCTRKLQCKDTFKENKDFYQGNK